MPHTCGGLSGVCRTGDKHCMKSVLFCIQKKIGCYPDNLHHIPCFHAQYYFRNRAERSDTTPWMEKGAPCPCGSGKKFKICTGYSKRDAPSAAAMNQRGALEAIKMFRLKNGSAAEQAAFQKQMTDALQQKGQSTTETIRAASVKDQCAACKLPRSKVQKLMKCPCHLVLYCSSECQKAHRKQHRPTCTWKNGGGSGGGSGGARQNLQAAPTQNIANATEMRQRQAATTTQSASVPTSVPGQPRTQTPVQLPIPVKVSSVLLYLAVLLGFGLLFLISRKVMRSMGHRIE
jgi:hypothetical protein